MPSAAWMIVGAILAACLVELSNWINHQLSLQFASPSQRYSAWWYAAALVIGPATAWIVTSELGTRNSALLVLVTCLTLIQAPLDAKLHLLSRGVTLLTIAAIATTLVLDWNLQDRSYSFARHFLPVFGVVGIYVLLYSLSPRSLGWGDVLLVVPLSLSIVAVDHRQLVVWQFLASLSGASHGVIRRFANRSSSIPFGPHLLGTAWLVLATSVSN